MAGRVCQAGRGVADVAERPLIASRRHSDEADEDVRWASPGGSTHPAGLASDRKAVMTEWRNPSRQFLAARAHSMAR